MPALAAAPNVAAVPLPPAWPLLPSGDGLIGRRLGRRGCRSGGGWCGGGGSLCGRRGSGQHADVAVDLRARGPGSRRPDRHHGGEHADVGEAEQVGVDGLGADGRDERDAAGGGCARGVAVAHRRAGRGRQRVGGAGARGRQRGKGLLPRVGHAAATQPNPHHPRAAPAIDGVRRALTALHQRPALPEPGGVHVLPRLNAVQDAAAKVEAACLYLADCRL
eukprot:4755410-Pleurochrysis_carterae.AAC.5